MQIFRSHVLICGGTGCTSSNSPQIMEEFEKLIKKNSIDNEVKVVKTGCFGLCAQGPIVVVYPEGSMYTMVKVEDVEEIVNEHLIKGRVVKRLLAGDHEADPMQSLDGVEFFKKQKRTVEE